MFYVGFNSIGGVCLFLRVGVVFCVMRVLGGLEGEVSRGMFGVGLRIKV